MEEAYSGSWDIAELGGSEFCWLHLHLPNPFQNPKQLHTAHLPFLNFRDILYLTNHGSFCATFDNALLFRVNSSDSPYSNFPFRFAARLTQNSLITVSSEESCGLGFLTKGELPRPDNPTEEIAIFIEGDDRRPKSVSNVLVHVLHHFQVRHLRQHVFDLRMQLSAGEGALKPMLEKIHVDVERAHQVIGFNESVLTRVKEECSRMGWFPSDDITALEDLIGQLGMLKGDVVMIARRATAIQLSLNSRSSDRRSFISNMAFVVAILSLIVTAFGMNVGGIPWTDQSNPKGFQNVMLLCLSSAFCALLLFSYTIRPRGTLLEQYKV